MDNQVTITADKGKTVDTQPFIELHKAVEYINHRIAQWNIDSIDDLNISLRKVPSDAETLSVQTGDTTNVTADMI